MNGAASKERRIHRRIHFIKEVEVVGVGMRRCSDLSIGGMYLETVVGFPAGDSIQVRFKLHDGDDRPMEVRARVLYSHENVGVGLSFVDLSEENRQRLQEFIDRG